MKEKELAMFCKKLSILVKSGYDIKKSLKLCIEELNKKSKSILEEVMKYINEGESLSDAFYNTNKFSAYFINMIRYGEMSGNLEEALNYLYKFYDEEFKIKTKIKEAFYYPIILVNLVIIISIFGMVYLVPRYKELFEGITEELPLITRMVFTFSDFLINNYKYLLISFGIFVISLLFVGKKVYFKGILDYLKITLLKDIFLNKSIVRFSNTLSSLSKSGVNIIDCMALSINVLDNDFLYSKLQESKIFLKDGKNLSFCIDKCEVFPKSIISMIRVGEESGNLEEVLDTISDFYKSEFEIKLQILIKNIEPMLIIICGGIVGLFAFSMIIPMYDIMNFI